MRSEKRDEAINQIQNMLFYVTSYIVSYYLLKYLLLGMRNIVSALKRPYQRTPRPQKQQMQSFFGFWTFCRTAILFPPLFHIE